MFVPILQFPPSFFCKYGDIIYVHEVINYFLGYSLVWFGLLFFPVGTYQSLKFLKYQIHCYTYKRFYLKQFILE